MEENDAVTSGGCGDLVVRTSTTPIVTYFKLTVEICEVRVNHPFVLIIQLWNSKHQPAGRYVFERCIESETAYCKYYCETFSLPIIQKSCSIDELCGSVLVHYLN